MRLSKSKVTKNKGKNTRYPYNSTYNLNIVYSSSW